MKSDITTQEMLVHPAKNAQEGSHARPHAFGRVGVNLTVAIAVIVACPLVEAMLNGGMSTIDQVVAIVFIGINGHSRLGEWMHRVAQGFAFRIFNNAQPDLPAHAPNRAQHGRTVILKGATSTLLIGTPPREIVGVKVLPAFFPPHSETSRHFQFQLRGQGFGAGGARHWPGGDVATSRRFCRPASVRARVGHWTYPGQTPEAARPQPTGPTGFLQTPCPCTGDTLLGSLCIDRRAAHSRYSPGRSVLPQIGLGSGHIESRWDANTSSARRHLFRRRATQLRENPCV